MSLRSAFAGLAAALALGIGGARAAEGDMTVGRADAPVTVVEYASVTCGHCAHWQKAVWPAFKAKYVDTGKVRFVLRELPTAPGPAAVDGFLAARCAGPERYFEVVHRLMADQKTLFAGNTEGWLRTASKLGDEALQTCLGDAEAQNAFWSRIEANAAEHKVAGTPAFFVNGKPVEGGAALEELDAAIQPLLKGR
ncbi:MAG TPA: thioredoxin domain-containing protein [Caulobacteraceae bacterium]|nr:thioredoxin domain-containing protein [Caulobacteraceae bacterium]